jgi:hypothetical protein
MPAEMTDSGSKPPLQRRSALLVIGSVLAASAVLALVGVLWLTGRDSATSTGSAAPIPGAPLLSAGDDHTCTIDGGTISCWGANDFGQLGNGTTTDSAAPVAVAGVTKVVQVAAGSEHTCALANGEVSCWGNNDVGQLGTGTTVNSLTPVAVPALDVVTQIATGDDFTCALQDRGDMMCWGDNQDGQLGNNESGVDDNGDYIFSTTPVAVLTDEIGPISQIAAGFLHTCALSNGEAYCWGYNELGQLGNNEANLDDNGDYVFSATPTAVVGVDGTGTLSGITQISAGDYQTCAVANGDAYCWGANLVGTLGNGESGYAEKVDDDDEDRSLVSAAPVAVVADELGVVTQITTGGAHSCSLTNGEVFCWGWNDFGSLGNDSGVNGDFGLVSSAPVAVAPHELGVATQISTGLSHTCAMTNDGVFCWGGNKSGQLGNGESGVDDNDEGIFSSTPVAVLDIDRWLR